MNVLFYNIDIRQYISFKVLFRLQTRYLHSEAYTGIGDSIFLNFILMAIMEKEIQKKNSSLPLVPLSPSVICMYYVYAPVKTVNHFKGIYSKVYICIDERKYISGSVVYISSTLYLL